MVYREELIIVKKRALGYLKYKKKWVLLIFKIEKFNHSKAKVIF